MMLLRARSLLAFLITSAALIVSPVMSYAQNPSYTLSVSPLTPASINLFTAASATSTVTITPANGYNGTTVTVTCTVVGRPPGSAGPNCNFPNGSTSVTLTVTPPPGPLSVTLTVSTTNQTGIGTYPIRLDAVDNGGLPPSNGEQFSHLFVTPLTPSYTISASALTPVPVNPGGVVTSIVTMTPVNGYNGTVTVFCAVITPPGSSGPFCKFTPPATSPFSTQLAVTSPTSTLTVTTTTQTGGGTYPISVTGVDANNLPPSNGAQSLALVVTPLLTLSYTLSLSPLTPDPISYFTVASPKSIITVNPANGYNGIVTINCVVIGRPPGLAGPDCSPPAPLTVGGGSAVSTLTVSITNRTGPGTYPIHVTGVDRSGLAPSNGIQFLSLNIVVPVGLVIPFQPNVPQGGRTVAVAVNPVDNRQLIVASETGGLFWTTDSGNNWQHFDNLKSYDVNDVAYAPGSNNIVVASAYTDFMVSNNGFIWRSVDGGNTWSQPPGSLPVSSQTCPIDVSAWGLSFQPGSENLYVATDCGLAVSNDQGATWSPNYIAVDPHIQSQNSIRAVLALRGRRLNVAATSGLYSSLDSGTTWTPAAAGSPNFAGSNHSFAASPYNPNYVFFAGGTDQLFISTDAGIHWTDLKAPPPPYVSRPPFVRIAKSISGVSNQFDVYWGNGVYLYRTVFVDLPSGPTAISGWTQLNSDHSDPADVGFDSQDTYPQLLATDGGIHKTPDAGGTWTLTGGGPGGYNALQITEVTGEQVTGTFPKQGIFPHLNLYYATQDNNIYASPDGGVTWPAQVCSEGYSLQTPPTSVTGAMPVTGSGPTCMIFLTGQVFADVRAWPGDTNQNLHPFQAPYMLPKAFNYVQDYSSSGSDIFELTKNAGTTWSTSFQLALAASGFPKVAGPAANPTVYEGVVRGGTTSDGQLLIGLVKATNLYGPGAPDVKEADIGFGGLGLFPTDWAWYTVFAVDPNNADHLIAPDIDTNQMKFSCNAGQNWFVDPTLTSVVTNFGTFQFRLGPFTLVHSIAFDPYNSCDILVGTAQNGVIQTLDGGHSWQKIDASEVITNLSSFYFPPTGNIIVSTYGRGLWQLAVKRQSPSCTFETLPSIPIPIPTIVDPSTGVRIQFKDHPKICLACQYLIVTNGAITDVKMQGTHVLKIIVAGGSIHQFDASKKEVPLQIPNGYSASVGNFGGNQAFQSLLKEKTPIRGLVVDGDILKGVITSQAQLPFQPARIPYIRILSKGPNAGIPTAVPGDEVVVSGEGFARNTHGETPLQIRLANQIVADNVAVGEDGRFRAQVSVRQMPGDYQIVAEQKEGNRTSFERTYLKVVTQDRFENIEHKNP